MANKRGFKVQTNLKAGGNGNGKNNGGNGAGTQTDNAGYYLSPDTDKCVYYRNSAYNNALRKGNVLTPCTPV